MKREILSSNTNGCAALAPCGKVHICVGQLFMVFKRDELSAFIDLMYKVSNEMTETHGYNKVFFETGLPQMKVALSHSEVEQLIDLMNESCLALSIKDIIAENG